MSKNIRYILAAFSLCFITFAGYAQPTPSTPPGNPRPNIPIDGGISILAAAGLAYGAKKVYDARKGKEEETPED